MAKEKVKNDKKYFMKDFKAELKKVVWPTSKQMVNNVVSVITIVLITAVIVFVLDVIFGFINDFGIKKIKSQVQSNTSGQAEIVDVNQEESNNDSESEEQDINVETEGNDVENSNQENAEQSDNVNKENNNIE